MPLVIENNGIPDVSSNEAFILSCLYTVSPAANSNTARRLRARVFAGGVEKAIKSATFTENATDASISIELANVADRSAFTRTASIKLEVQEYLSGSWTTIKTYCDGAILATSDYDVKNNGDAPADTFSVTVQSVLQQKLSITPEQTIVLYDPAKVTVTTEDIEVVPNIDGTEGTPTVTSTADLNLGDVFQFLADQYGLTGFKSNINYEAWDLARVDFPAAQPLWNTVAGIIGNHSPRVSIDADDYLVIADGTVNDYVSARTLTTSNIKGIKLTKTIERFKGCHLTYQMKDTEWDYWVFDVQHKESWFEDVVGQYPYTTSEIWQQKFYKNSFPNTPVETRTLKEYHFVYSAADTKINATGEVFSYQNGQISRRDKREFALAKAPQAFITANAGYPNANAGFIASFGGPEELYSSASDDTWTESFVLTKTERETFVYQAHPFEQDSVYVAEHDHWVKGLITIDSDEQQLGEDFKQPLSKAQESGNLKEGQGSEWGTVEYRGESQKILKNRKVMIRTRGNTPLNSSGGVTTENYEDQRVGDVGIQVIKPVTKNVYITTGGDSTATLWRSVNGGEAPLVILQPLCHRLNKQQDYPGGVNVELPTYDETVSIGLVIDPRAEGRANSMGIFETISYTDEMDNEGGFRTTIQARQIA